MIPLTLGEIAGLVGGTVAAADRDRRVNGEAFVDSRSPVPGGLFVAVAGERVDGAEFAAAAVAAGAAGVLAARPVEAPAVVVPDVVQALNRLAAAIRGRLDLTVVGITGSSGKTTTKDLLTSLLEGAAPTVGARASQNNEIGVPLTVLRATDKTRFLVTELGARGGGHIASLAALARPRIGVVLNVGLAHLGEFGSQDAIAAAKGELVEALPVDGVAVLNADDVRVRSMATRTAASVRTFGRAAEADLRVVDVELDVDGHPTFRLQWRGESATVALRYVGEPVVEDAAAAALVALQCGQDLATAAAALSAAEPRSRWRMEVATNAAGVLVVNDAYNANPESMRAAVSSLVRLSARRPAARTMAVLGEMHELGTQSRAHHAALGHLVAQSGVDLVVVVGEGARPILDGAQSVTGWSGTASYAADTEEASRLVAELVQPGDIVLVKASRAAGLESVALGLLEPAPRPEAAR